MKYAVTGASGALGNLVISNLIKKGVDPDLIIAVIRNPEKAKQLSDLNVQVRIADYSDSDALKKAFYGVDKVLLISGNDPINRLQQHKNVISSAINASASQLIYTSGIGADKNTPISKDHFETETYIKASGLDYVILRNNVYHENFMREVAGAMKTGVIASAVGDGKFASAGRNDYAEAAAVVLIGNEHSKKTYELTGKAWGYGEFATIVTELIGKEVVYKQISVEEKKGILVKMGIPEVNADFLAKLDLVYSTGLMGTETSDLSDLIGRDAISLKDCLKEELSKQK